MATNQLFVWDATIPRDRHVNVYDEETDMDKQVLVKKSPEDIMRWMKKWCKKWCFQLEKGKETGYIHYQCRFTLIKKTVMNTLLGMFHQDGIGGVHLSQTSDGGKVDSKYVCKLDTRIDGPWDHNMDSDISKFIPIHVRNAVLKPWQEMLLYLLSVYDERIINVIYDPQGKKGKSWFCAYMESKGLAFVLPFINSYLQCMQFAYGELPKYEYDKDKFFTFLIDLPRMVGYTKLKIHDIWGAIENIKNGKTFDPRYENKKQTINYPTIAVFVNDLPDLNCLSKDRWKIWSIDNEMKLVPYKMYGEYGSVTLNMDLMRIPMIRVNKPEPVPAQITPRRDELDKALDDKIEQLLEIRKLRNENKIIEAKKLPQEKY